MAGKLGILGGTFDPPHLGHRHLAEEARAALRLDEILVIPTFVPPHKQPVEGQASAEQRLEMAEAAFGGMEGVAVSDMEIRRGGRSYTADTVEELRRTYPEAELWLLTGSDMLLSLKSWRRFDYLIKNVSIGAFSRVEGDGGELERFAAGLREEYGAAVTVEGSHAIEVSSSQLRRQLRERGGVELLAPEVYAYIIRNRLYGVQPDFGWLRQRAIEMLKPRRVPHVLGCEQEAVRLAERWGADVDEARTAAILHDITKRLTLREQLLLCEKYGIILDAVEREDEKLLHSKTGAEIARREFGVSDGVYQAIFWHTTGREDMSLLEKVIYLADYIEPTRDFPGLTELRALAYSSLDDAMRLAYRMSLENLRARGIAPHERTAGALQWLRDQEGKIK